MALFIPKETEDDDWQMMAPKRDYAIRLNPDDIVYLRFGMDKSFYFSIHLNQFDHRLVNAIDYEEGTEDYIGNLKEVGKTSLGRSNEAGIKLVHAFISRNHAEFEVNKNVVIMRDLGSVNGSFYYKKNHVFDIQNYLAAQADKKEGTDASDEITETFGPNISEILNRYKTIKEESK